MIALLDLDNTLEADPVIANWWSTKSPALSVIARHWFDVMKACGPDVRESLHNDYPAACLQHFPFAYVDAFMAHVNVGFYLGAMLPEMLRKQKQEQPEQYGATDCAKAREEKFLEASYLSKR